MIDLAKRSYKKEILDEEDIPFDHIALNMRELNSINTKLGGHKISIDGVKKIISSIAITQPITICEIGCGGGDNLHAIHTWCVENNMSVNFIGIDIKQACIDFAKQQYPALPCKWISSKYQKIVFNDQQPDIIFSALFCHHFMEEELIFMLQWMKQNAGAGFFINDLQRNYLAYYSIKILTGLFSKSYLVKNDAPLSVARGFVKIEWQNLLSSAGIKNYSISWKWAFRYLIVYLK